MIISPSVLRSAQMASPLGRSWVWRVGLCGIAALVITSASLAHQQLDATAPPRNADLINKARAASEPRSLREPSPAPPYVAPTAVVAAVTDTRPADAVPAESRAVAALVLVAVLPPALGVEHDAKGASEDHRRLLAQRRGALDRVRSEVIGFERALKAMDSSIASLSASSAEAVLAAEARRAQVLDSPESEAVARAQTAYNEAIGRERRAAALAAHGVPARQELEAAQIEVRAAAATLSAARRAAEMAATLASAQALQARAQVEIALAENQQQRAAQAALLADARGRLREAEQALAAGTEESR